MCLALKYDLSDLAWQEVPNFLSDWNAQFMLGVYFGKFTERSDCVPGSAELRAGMKPAVTLLHICDAMKIFVANACDLNEEPAPISSKYVR